MGFQYKRLISNEFSIALLFPGMSNVRDSLCWILERTKPGEALVFLSHATTLRRNGLSGTALTWRRCAVAWAVLLSWSVNRVCDTP